MFLTNLNNSVEFAICSVIPSREEPNHMESNPPICSIYRLPQIYMVGDFSGGYSQTDCKFNFNINVNITVDSYMNRSFNFSFSHQLKNLPASRILQLRSTSKIMAQFETIPQYLLFFPHYSFMYIWETSVAWGLHIF